MKLLNMLKPEFVHLDDRGKLSQLVSGGWAQVNVINSNAGTVRGDHWHANTREMFYIVAGAFRLVLKRGGCSEEHEIVAGNFFTIEPLTRHTFHYHEDTILVALYDKCVVLPDGSLDIHTN